MDKEIRFKSLEDLYVRILPALKSKTKEIHKDGYSYIHEEDIWNYLRLYKWMSSRDLDLGSMVNDIFEINIKDLNRYVEERLKDYHRTANKGEIDDDRATNNI